jgi:hypothetical protein
MSTSHSNRWSMLLGSRTSVSGISASWGQEATMIGLAHRFESTPASRSGAGLATAGGTASG